MTRTPGKPTVIEAQAGGWSFVPWVGVVSCVHGVVLLGEEGGPA